MQSSSRQRQNPNFWIPPDTLYESAEPIATRAAEPATPTRAAARTGPSTTPLRASGQTRPPPLPLSSQRTTFTAGPSTAIAASAPQRPPVIPRHSRAGKEFNRRERRFEVLFDQWTKKMAELEEEHRLVTLTCTNEEQSKIAMDDFNRKAQDVFTRFNDQIEALQMSSSEPGSSQSEASEDDDEEENADEDAEDIMAGPTPIRSRLNQEDAEEDEDDDDEEEEEEDGEEEDEEDDAEEGDDIEGDRASTPPSEIESGDETDHSARKSCRSKGYQSSEVSTGSLGIHTPPPTEVDEDWRATRRRQAREQRKADELASALPQRLRSGTLRGSSPASSAASSVPITAPPRPAAMSLFETLSSSPASASSMQASPYNASRRPSRDVSAHSAVDPDPNQITSRIDFLRRQNSHSGSDRSLSRPRQPSPSPSPITGLDETRIFRDQFDNWRNMARERSDHWIRKAEQQTEDSKSIYHKEQEEKHKRAQQLFIAHQDKLLQHYNRNRSGSTGQGSASANSPVNGFHARTGSFVASSSPHVMGPSASPTANRHGPASSSPVMNRPLHNSVSQTFQFAATPSQSPPSQQGHSQSPSHAQTRTWAPAQTGLSSTYPVTLNPASSSDSDDDNEAVDEEESDIAPVQTYNGTPPISIPNSTRGSFDHGHRRTQTQVFTGTPGGVGIAGGAPSTPRNNFPQPQPQSQHLRNSSSTTFSSSGTASTRSSGGWSGISGTSSNTTVTSSDTPGSRRGSVSDKSFVVPTGLHDHRKPTLPLPPGPTGPGASPPNAQAQPRWNLDGGSTTHSPASTLSRSSTIPLSAGTSTGSSRPTAQQWQAMLSSSPSPPVVTTTNGSATTSTASVHSSSSSRPIPTSINLGQSPSKVAWKTGGQPSPPIPMQTRPINVSPLPPQWTRSDSSSTLSSSPSFAASFSTPKPSPPLRSVMSNSDMASSSGSSGLTLKVRSSVASFSKSAAAEEERESLERPSRSMSPTKPGLVPIKAALSPATVTSTSTDTAVKASENEPVLYPLRKESKRKVKAKERERQKVEEEEKRKKADEEEQRRKAEEAEAARKAEEERQKEQEVEERLQQERELEERRKKEREVEAKRQREVEAKRQRERAEEDRRKKERQEMERQRKLRLDEERRKKREEEERLREEREEEERREKEEELRLKNESEELERQKVQDEVRRREEILRKREEEIRRREEELERTRKEEELERKESELRKREDAIRRKEEELRRQREERLKEDKDDVAEPESSSPTQTQPSQSIPSGSTSQTRKVDQKKRKKARDEQKEREAALARQQAEEERKREEERQIEEQRLREEERLYAEEQQRIADQEARLQREREDEEAANALAAALEAERVENQRLESERLRQLKIKEELKRQEAAALEEMNRRRMAHKQREEEQRQAQMRRDREEAVRLQREEEEQQAQWQEQRRRYDEEQRRHRSSRAEEERRQEEEQRRQEERIRQENDRLTEMFKAKERTQQMSTNMPKRYSDAWEAYNAKWKSLLSSNQSEERPVLTFATVPWPTLVPPSGPEAITRNAVGSFVLSQWHSKEKSRRDRIREALLRWHPDRFESRYLSMVPEGEEKENVRSGVGNVARSLNELLTAESSSGHL